MFVLNISDEFDSFTNYKDNECKDIIIILKYLLQTNPVL